MNSNKSVFLKVSVLVLGIFSIFYLSNHNDLLIKNGLWNFASPVVPQGASIVQSFKTEELFGVSQPDKIIDFDLAQTANLSGTYGMAGPDGVNVPFQLLEGGKKVAVRTNLGANEEKQWILYTGNGATQPSGSNAVVVSDNIDYHEITNGITGVRIPTASAITSGNLNGATPAPVQGIRYRDGVWTGTGSILRYYTGSQSGYESFQVANHSVTFLERGPLKTVVRVHYERSGGGYYTSLITLEAGQPSILFEEDSTLDLAYSMGVYDGLDPDQARYRGHRSSSIENGYKVDGTIYNPMHERSAQDAFVDLTFTSPRSYPRVSVWDRWSTDTGPYWQFYDKDAGSSSNLLGVFSGQASRALGAANSGIGISTGPSGINDLDTFVGINGVTHVVYRAGSELWYRAFGANLTAGNPIFIGSGLSAPDIAQSSNGTVVVAAYDNSAPNKLIMATLSGGSFTREEVSFADDLSVTYFENRPYHAIAGTRHFLMILAGDGQIKLFSRALGENNFVFEQNVVPHYNPSEGRKPQFTALQDGRVALTYTDSGGYADVMVIEAGARNFAPGQQRLFFHLLNRIIDGVNYGGSNLNFGTAIDGKTGNMFLANHAGDLMLLEPSSTGALARTPSLTDLSVPVQHHGTGLNRRSIATNQDESVFLISHGDRLYIYENGAWRAFSSANNLGISGEQVVFSASENKFVVFGRHEGILKVWTWQVGDSALTELSSFSDTEKKYLNLSVAINKTSPDARKFDRVRFQWRFFVSTKADLSNPLTVQPVAKQMNLHGGINLNKIHRYVPDFPDPASGYGGLYMDASVVRNLITQLRADTGGPHGGGIHGYLYNKEPSARGLIDMWADSSGATTEREADKIRTLAQNILNAYVNGDGIYDEKYSYWHGGLRMNESAVFIDAILADPTVTANDKKTMKGVASLFGNILWDDDFVPLFVEHGLNLGTANMPIQQTGYRDFYTLFLRTHPFMTDKISGVASRTSGRIGNIINSYGAEIGSTHYISASVTAMLNSAQQIQRTGIDLFATEPRLAKFAEFYMNFATPPEPRFNNLRKLPAIGDGSTESDGGILGQLATAFRVSDTTFSKRLMWVWEAMGKAHQGFFGTTIVKINEALSKEDPRLGDATFPGWYSVLRNGWETLYETAIWIVNGDYYSDHRHSDQGNVVMYALGAPLSIDWGSFYTPHVYGSYMHSVVVPESRIGHSWNQNGSEFISGGISTKSKQESFSSFGQSSFSSSSFDLGNSSSWTRNVASIHPNDALPVVLIRDTFSGSNANTSKISTLNLMADGAVQTPGGPVTPTKNSYYTRITPNKSEKPSSGSVFNVPAGLQKFSFVGQTWNKHPTKGIDWDLYTLSNENQQAFIGNWGHDWHGSSEMSQFQTANGRGFEERQHILRIKGNGPFQTIILPYRKGEKPSDLSVTQNGNDVVISHGSEVTRVNPSFYAYTNGNKKTLTTFGVTQGAGNGITVSGGATEVVIQGSTATITLHGASGTRTITLPSGTWGTHTRLTKTGPTTYQASYTAGVPLIITLNGSNVVEEDPTDVIPETGGDPAADLDGDGITDDKDICPKTPEHLAIYVNDLGCPQPITDTFDIKPDFTGRNLTDFTNFEIGRSAFARITFTERVKLIRDSGSAESRLNLDSHIKLSKQRVEINTTGLPELNKKARITMYNVDVANPRILRDGFPCTTCTITSFNRTSKTLTFTVNGFSVYSVDESPSGTTVITPEEETTPPPSTETETGDTSSDLGDGTGNDVGDTQTEEPQYVTTNENPDNEVFNDLVLDPAFPPSPIDGSVVGAGASSSINAKTFTRDLTIGSEGQDVKALQVFLNNNGFVIAKSGPGSRGNETTTFGNLTRDALIRFQEAYRSEVLTPGGFVRGTGYFGPSTRAKILALQGSTSSAPTSPSSPAPTTPTTPAIPPSSSSGTFTRDLTIGSEGQDVKALQVFLNHQGFTIAQTGPGSEGNETTFFGNLTKEALIRFQNFYRSDILTPVDLTQGTGYFGPSTRAKIEEIKR